jgi:hypothetical protein
MPPGAVAALVTGAVGAHHSGAADLLAQHLRAIVIATVKPLNADVYACYEADSCRALASSEMCTLALTAAERSVSNELFGVFGSRLRSASVVRSGLGVPHEWVDARVAYALLPQPHDRVPNPLAPDNACHRQPPSLDVSVAQAAVGMARDGEGRARERRLAG